MDEIPRYEVERQIRRYLPKPTRVLNPTENDLIVLYRALNARDRALVYRVAVSLIEHATDYSGENNDHPVC